MEWFLLEEWVLQIILKLQERVMAQLLLGITQDCSFQTVSLNVVRMRTCSLKTQLQWRPLPSCRHLACLSRAPNALQAAGQHFISWFWLHSGRNCFLPVWKRSLLYEAAQWWLCGVRKFPIRNVSGPKATCSCKLFNMIPGQKTVV